MLHPPDISPAPTHGEQQQRWTAHTYTSCARNAPRCSLVPFGRSLSFWLTSLNARCLASASTSRSKVTTGRIRTDAIHCDGQFGSLGSCGIDPSCTAPSRKPQLIPRRNLGCFITAEYEVVLCFGVFYRSESSIYGLNLQTISKITRFNF